MERPDLDEGRASPAEPRDRLTYVPLAPAQRRSDVMALAMAASPGHGGSGVAPVTGALLLYFTGYVLLTGVRLVPVGAGGTAVRLGDRPELARACRLSMGIAMVAMLLMM